MPNCEFCGKELEEGQKCDCEKAVSEAEETVAEVVENAADKAEDVKAVPVDSGSQASKNKIKAIVAAVVGLILIIDIASAASTSAIKKPVKQYYKAVNKVSGEILGKSIYDKDMMDKDDWEDIDEYYEKLEDALDDYHDRLEDEYGKNVKVSYKLKGKSKIDKKRLEEVEDEYDDYYDMDVKITKGYYISADVTIKGKDDKRETYQSFAVYKIKGAGWKLHPSTRSYLY